MKSQGSQPKIFSARKNVKKKLGANPNQPQITAFYRAIEKNEKRSRKIENIYEFN